MPKRYRYDISCVWCGKFISYADFENDRARVESFTPDSEFGPEDITHEHVECAEKRRERFEEAQDAVD